MVRGGTAVDYESRRQVFRDKPILELGIFVSPSRSTIGGRVGVEQMILAQRDYTPEDIQALQTIAREDKEWRYVEQVRKTEVEHQIALESMRSITVEVPDAEWLAGERESRGVPVIAAKVGSDDRTQGGVGVDVLKFPATSDEPRLLSEAA
jgi:hypothetical protein